MPVQRLHCNYEHCFLDNVGSCSHSRWNRVDGVCRGRRDGDVLAVRHCAHYSLAQIVLRVLCGQSKDETTSVNEIALDSCRQHTKNRCQP